MAGQPAHLYPRQHQKAGVVGHPGQTNRLLTFIPAEKLIACRRTPRRRTEQQTSQIAPVSILHQILEVFPDDSPPQVMIVLQVRCEASCFHTTQRRVGAKLRVAIGPKGPPVAASANSPPPGLPP